MNIITECKATRVGKRSVYCQSCRENAEAFLWRLENGDRVEACARCQWIHVRESAPPPAPPPAVDAGSRWNAARRGVE